MNCDVKFERMYTITEDGVSKTTFPTKLDGYNYTVTPTCTNGSATWDYTNWRMNIPNNANPAMKCTVSFVKTKIEVPVTPTPQPTPTPTPPAPKCVKTGEDYGGGMEVWSGGGISHRGVCDVPNGCYGEQLWVNEGEHKCYYVGCNRQFIWYDCGTALSRCQQYCGT